MSDPGAGAGAGADARGSGEGKWACDYCTYENYPLSLKCTMCRALKPLARRNILDLEEARSLDVDGDEASERSDALVESEAATDVATDVATDEERKWSCAGCTFFNWPRSTRCAMCSRARPDDEWLRACLGLVEGERYLDAVERYLEAGGDPARRLTRAEALALDRPSAFDAGHTLVHLAIRFRREDALERLLARTPPSRSALKRAPSHVAPDLAAAIRRRVAADLRDAADEIAPWPTLALPADIEALPRAIRDQLWAELLDSDAQRALADAQRPAINWARGCARLHALWNRSSGDCLLDATLQATWGAFDRDGALRDALARTLGERGPHARALYARWSERERRLAAEAGYDPSEAQLEAEWARAAHAAAQRGRSLHELHVWALAHVTRRPLVVYAQELVRSFRGEALGYARFQGVYLPLLLDPARCSDEPACLGYTRGHFSALVALEARDADEDAPLPLADVDGKPLPVHFLSADELGHEEAVLRRWMRTRTLEGSRLLVARRRRRPRPLLVAQMLEEWLNHYRRLAQQTTAPFPPRTSTNVHDFSSEGETDEE